MTCDVVGIDPSGIEGKLLVVGSHNIWGGGISFFGLSFDFCLGLMTFFAGMLIFRLKGFDFWWGWVTFFGFVGLLPDSSLASCLLFIQEVEG